MNLTGGTSLVEQVECLGVEGIRTLGEIPLSLLVMENWIAPVELIGILGVACVLTLSFAGGGVTLSLEVNGRFESMF